MYNHEPEGYKCPFCRVVGWIEDKHVITKQSDVFYRDDYITAFISSHTWPNNNWNILIIPNEHIENIYSLPKNLSQKIHEFEKQVAVAFKKIYKCDAVSTRQHNEPCWNQDVWHYHLHVLPRYENDKLYTLHEEKYQEDEKQRAFYASKLREYFT